MVAVCADALGPVKTAAAARTTAEIAVTRTATCRAATPRSGRTRVPPSEPTAASPARPDGCATDRRSATEHDVARARLVPGEACGVTDLQRAAPVSELLAGNDSSERGWGVHLVLQVIEIWLNASRFVVRRSAAHQANALRTSGIWSSPSDCATVWPSRESATSRTRTHDATPTLPTRKHPLRSTG